jgi:hypothetical protein
MDVPYENKRQGYKHLSITVQEDGQIQRLDEAEAGFRLASVGATPPARTAPVPSPKPPTRRRAAAKPPPTQPAAVSLWRRLTTIGRWLWVIATIVVLAALLHGTG